MNTSGLELLHKSVEGVVLEYKLRVNIALKIPTVTKLHGAWKPLGNMLSQPSRLVCSTIRHLQNRKTILNFEVFYDCNTSKEMFYHKYRC